jgi:xanthine dehydrogenase accessory factor
MGILCLKIRVFFAVCLEKRYPFVTFLAQLLSRLATDSGVLVSVNATRGSVPREAGTWMAVFADAVLGTIGGGRLEWDAIAHARSLLVDSGAPRTAAAPAPEVKLYRLGPSLGQCCGGEVQLQYEPVTSGHAAALRVRLAAQQPPLALFGGGHVGQALVRLLAGLDMPVCWIDSRDGIFPADVPAGVQCEHSEPVQAAVPTLAAGSRVLIMSFSHAEDLDIVAACLARQRARADLPYVGLIGSKTKWAAFRSRLLARGFGEAELGQITCPIGIPGIADKRPEAIAIAVAAQLLLLGNTP